MKLKIFLFLIISAVVVSAQTSGDLKRDSRYNPVTGYYDADNDEIKSVTPDTPLPTIDNMANGYYGSTLITDTEVNTGTYYCLQVLADCVIDSLVDSGRDGDDINGLALNAGTILFGKNITRIKLTSGSVIAYKKE